MGQVYAPQPCINVGIGVGSPPTTACPPATTCVPITPPPLTCPVNPGNGLGNNPPGANPMQVNVLVPIAAFNAVIMGAGGLILADNTNPAHRNAVLGLVDNNYIPGQMANVYTYGPITNPISGVGGWLWTVNLPIYLSTLGQLTQVQPLTGFLLKMGFALSANTMFIDIDRPFNALQTVRVVTYPWAATINVDLATTDVADITLTGNSTINFINGVDGQYCDVRLKQDGVGSRLVAWGAMASFPGGVAPTLSTSAGVTDVVVFQRNAALNKYMNEGFFANFV